MKLALFNDYIPGVVIDDRVTDASRAVGDIMQLPGVYRMPALIEAFDKLRPALEGLQAADGVPLTSVQLRAPVPQPPKILCAAANFREGVDAPLMPLTMFLKSPAAICDPGGTIVLPHTDAEVFQHEAELAVVVGKRASSVSEADAMDHVFGYSCFIDGSARGPGRAIGFNAKSYDTFAPIGPWIVTKDEIPDPSQLQVRLWVDGVLRQDYSMNDIAHPVPEIVSGSSEISTLLPGDVLACGTNHQQLGPLQDGETVEIEIDNIGRLTVSVSDTLKRSWNAKVDDKMAARMRDFRRKGERI